MTCIEVATMDDGTKASFQKGKDYDINCAFSLDGDTHISVVNSEGNVHHFDVTEEWFSKSFIVSGDLESVWEEV